MCGGGGGGGGETKYNWNGTLEPMWQQLLADSTHVAYNNQPKTYEGQRIADFDPLQQKSIANIWDMTQAGGTPAAISANNQAENTLNDKYLSGASANPYAAQANQYAGQSPQFNQMLQTGVTDLAQGYQQGTAADTTRMFNMAGAFGGSAHQNAMANNQNAFGKTLNNYLTGMQNDQYNRSGTMDESRLQRGASAYEGERGRQMGAIGAGQNANQMFYQGNNQLMAAGDAQRSMQQDQLNMTYQDWLDKQNIDFKNADWLSGMYSKAQGGMAANSTTTNAGYQASPYSQLIGAGLMYKGMT